jgi:periplasmic divalent cation tolerance protein
LQKYANDAKQWRTKMSRYITVFVTVPNKNTAMQIKDIVLQKRIVSCVSITSGLDSFYWWKGKIEHSKEFLLTMKTLKTKFKMLQGIIKAHHPYEVPEIISLNIIDANKDYLEWIDKSLNKTERR